MADENIVTNIVANADFSNLIADVHKVTASLSKLQEQIANSNKMLGNQIAVMNKSFSDTLRSTGQFSTHFVSLQSDVDKFGKNLDSGRLKLGQYFQTLQTHTRTSGGLIRDLAKQQVALQNAILQPLGRNAQGLMQFNVHVPRGLDEIKNKTAIARQELQIMNKVMQEGAGQLINWGKNTQWAGRQLTVGLSLPLAAFGKAAADAFRQADAELVRLTKVYGDVAGTSSQQLGKVRDDVIATSKELSKAYGVSFKDTIGLAADIAATGKQGNELLASVKETSRLAVLGEVDRQDAMKATLAIQTAFKQNTEQLSESINFLNAVENQTSTTLNDLVEAIPKAGPVIQGLGGSVQDLALYLTAMREGGINASEGANALKSALASLINPTDVAVDKFKGFGIDLLGIVQKNAGNVTGTLMELQGALDALNPLQKQQAIEQLFGKFQFSRMNALFENLGKQGSQTLQVLDLMKTSSQELANVAGRELSAVTESASGKYRRAVEGLKADLAGIGESFLNINTTLINVVDNVLKFVNNLPKPLKQALSFIGGLTAVAGPLIMLTGVLANFFGYILKGIGHMKSFFRGGEGWKYLTPEMLAAEKAGRLIEQSFYSDAKAAAVLQQALRNLIDEFSILEGKAKTGAVSVAPAITTMAGNLVQAAGPGGRQVNPTHPLLSPRDTRSMSHLNPVAGMTDEQKLGQTLFGVVPGAPKVNNKIKDNPQMYMSGNLPNVPGFTTINGVSTGIVAEEAAKWHAMTGAMAMQSNQELEVLKREVSATGNITSELSASYSALLPHMTALTQKAAAESATIVAELKAGKLTVDQARSKIIQLNYEIEAAMGAAATQVAQSTGRSINLTQLPLVNQPVVDPSGKSNMKEITRPGRTRDLLTKIARGLGVKTYGAPYSIETTVPKRLANGGEVYLAGGDQVPGGPKGTDTVPAWLTPGEFVVNAQATKENLPLLRQINNGGISGKSYNNSGGLTGMSHDGFMPAEISNQILKSFGHNSLRSKKEANLVGSWGMILPKSINDALAGKLGADGALGADLINALKEPDRLIDLDDFLAHNGVNDSDRSKILSNVAKDMASKITPGGYYKDLGLGNIAFEAIDPQVKGLEGKYPGISLAYQKDRMTPGRRDTRRAPRPGETQSEANKRGGSSPTGINIPGRRKSNYGAGARTADKFGSGNVWAHFTDKEFEKNTSMLAKSMGFLRRVPNPSALKSNPFQFGWGTSRRFADGGSVYMSTGGMVPQYLAEGDEVQPARVRFASAYESQRSKGFIGSGMANSGMAGMGVGLGMQMAGGAIGGQAGQMMQFASVLPMMAPGMISGIPKMLGNITTGLKGVGGMASLAGKAMGLAFRVGPLAGVTLAITAATMAFKKFKEEQAQNRIEQTNSISITKKSAEEAGIKYNNLSDSIKSINDQLELTRAKGKNAYETLNSSGIQGLTLSIKELKQRIKEAKTNQKELVSSFTNIDSGTDAQKQAKVLEIATNLKAQFVAAGMSAQEATNKIYAIISASDKADMAFSAISSAGFRGITDEASAANAMITKLGENMNTLGAEDLGSAISNVAAALDANLNKIRQTKDENGKIITEQEAMSKILDDINKKEGSKTKITIAQLNALEKTHPELAKILNTGDDVAGMYAKWRLTLAGVNMDLSKISSEQAQQMAKFNAALDTAIAKSEAASTGSGIAFKSQNSIKALQKQIAAGGQQAAIASQKTQEQINKEIKLIDKKIQKINEEAEARKKALDAQQNKENLALEIQKAQMEYADKLAAGDMAGAAQAQLKIKQLVNERESQKAIDAIEENRAKREKALIAQREKLQAQSEKASANLASAQNNAALSTTRMNKIDQYQNEYQRLVKEQAAINLVLKNDPSNKKALKDQQELVRGPLGDLAKQIGADVKGSDKVLSTELKKIFGGKLIDESGNSLSGKVMPSTHPKGVATYKAGSADSALSQDATNALAGAKAITGGKTLADVYNVILTGQAKGRVVDVTNVGSAAYNGRTWGETYKGNKAINKASFFDTFSNKTTYETLIRENGLKKGDSFILNGVKYNVKGPSSIVRDGSYNAPAKALGGRFSAGQTITINDRINSLGTQYEGIKFDRSGVVYPNADTMPKFNVPSSSYNVNGGMQSGSAGSQNIYITVNPSQGMDEKALANMVISKLKTASTNIKSKTGEPIIIGGRA